MNLTRKDVQLFETVGRTNFIDTPANMEYHDGSPATDKDFRAIMSLRAALTVFQTMGLVDPNLKLELRLPHQS